MLNNFRNLQSLYQSLGARWLMFRVGYALRMRTGFVRKQMPSYAWEDRPLETWLKKRIPSTPEKYAHWRKQNSPKFFFSFLRAERSDSGDEAQFPSDVPWNPKHVVNEAERVLNGELKYFEHKFIKTGFPPDWHKDPITGIGLDSNKHWSEISDNGDVDIKFIWEASRFSMVYTLVRAYASTGAGKYAEAFWELIQSWAESNPPNTGPNWMDGQEAALRLMAWTFGFYAFMDSPSTTPERIAQSTIMVAAHAERIYKNIDYAISTHSNHTISEAFGLWLVGLLFSELKDAEKYFALGRRLLEQEAAAQIFPDGSYSMYSLNYHRFILQIYFYAIRLGELNKSPFSESLKRRVAKSIDYLYQLIDSETGQMPVYGSNDGALILPLNNCNFTDYRPLLQLGSYLTRGTRFFESGAWDEPLYWLYGSQALHAKVESPPQTSQSYADGGISILRGSQSKAIIRCTDFRSRPSHADQLHVDLWWRGKNIACDAGTYLYSGEGIWRNGLAHSAVHNIVVVDHQDQMKMVSRFTWTNWSRGKVLKHGENLWQGEHDGYKPVTHKRTVMALDGDRWLVVDHLEGRQIHHYALHWLLNDFPYEQQENFILLSIDSMKYKIQVGLVEGKPTFSVVRGDPNSTRGWRSRYYGDKELAISAMLETRQPRVCFWTFFGFESDKVELVGNDLQIGFDAAKTSINLQSLTLAPGAHLSWRTVPRFA
jgi:heparinase II/III-like protein